MSISRACTPGQRERTLASTSAPSPELQASRKRRHTYRRGQGWWIGGPGVVDRRGQGWWIGAAGEQEARRRQLSRAETKCATLCALAGSKESLRVQTFNVWRKGQLQKAYATSNIRDV